MCDRRHPFSLFVFCLLYFVFSCSPSNALPTRIKDIKGAERTIPDSGSLATVLIFITTDCPIANSYVPEINRIYTQFKQEKIACFVVYSDRSIPLKSVRKHAKEFGYLCPAVRDDKHVLIDLVKATVTPEAAILSPEGKLLYRGRIDDRYLDFGKKRTHPTTRDLYDALDAVVHGKPVAVPVTKAIGCFIPR